MCGVWTCMILLVALFLGFALSVIGFLVWGVIQAAWPWRAPFVAGLLAGGAFAVACARVFWAQCQQERTNRAARRVEEHAALLPKVL